MFPFIGIFLIGLFFLFLPVAALISVLRKRIEGNDKLIWIVLIVFMPFIGSLLYFLIGRRQLQAHQIRNSNQYYVKY